MIKAEGMAHCRAKGITFKEFKTTVRGYSNRAASEVHYEAQLDGWIFCPQGN